PRAGQADLTMERFRTLDSLDVRGKRVLVRSDLNVPVQNGMVSDIVRIERQAPTLRELSDKGAKVIVLSHFERAMGKVVPSMSIKRIAPALARAVGKSVEFAGDCAGPLAKGAVAKMKDGDVLLLENTRFHPGEESDDVQFAKDVASLGDIFVN